MSKDCNVKVFDYDIKVFDHRLFIDDVTTPLSVTMKPARILRSYIQDGQKMIDVVFEYRPNEISKGHFSDLAKKP